MKQKTISLSIAFFFTLFTSIFSNDFDISFADPSFTLKPLSERGQVYFKKQDTVAQAALHGFVGNRHGNATHLAQYGNVAMGIEQGNVVSSTTCGDYNVSATIDPISMLQLLKAGSQAVSRLVDINGHYYRDDMHTIREDILYALDKERYQIYQSTGLLSYAYEADFTYLTIKWYELEVAIAACGSKKSAMRSAALEAKEIVESLLRSVASKTTLSPETRHEATIKALEDAIQVIRDTKFKHKKDKKRLLHEYEHLLAREESQYRALLAQHATERAQQQAIQLQRSALQQRCLQSFRILEESSDDQLIWQTWCGDSCPTIASLLDARAASLQAIKKQGPTYQSQSYALSQDANALLAEASCDSALFFECYGNQYQQSLQNEAIAIVEEAAQLHATSVLYSHRAAIVQCAEAACAYNSHGDLHHASTIIDFCWSLLSWGATITEAVIEGAVAGVVGAVVDIYEHPVHATVSLLVGSRVMLAYQLSKVIYTVADLGITAMIDYEAACEKWDSYLEPVNNVIDAIRNKQLSVADAVRGATQCGVQIYAQTKLLNGLQSLYDGVKTQAVTYVRDNVTASPERYFATPDGQLCKASLDSLDPSIRECPPSCINQYEQFKQSLKIEEFTSIIKTTKHGVQRLIERKFTPGEVKVLYHTPDITRVQSDGAEVFIKLIAPDRYNIMIYNPLDQKLITAMKSIDLRNLNNLGKNYGWTI